MLMITGFGVCPRILLHDDDAMDGGVSIVRRGLFWTGRPGVVDDPTGGHELVWWRGEKQVGLLYYADQEKAEAAAKVLGAYLTGKVTGEKWWKKRVTREAVVGAGFAVALVAVGVMAGGIWSRGGVAEAKVVGLQTTQASAPVERVVAAAVTMDPAGVAKQTLRQNGPDQAALTEQARQRIRTELMRLSGRKQAPGVKAADDGGFVPLAD